MEERRGGGGWHVEAVTYLTSAEEYPDDEYLDMSKSSSLKETEAQVSFLFFCVLDVHVAQGVWMCSPVRV